MRLRIEKLELQVSVLEKRLWVLIIIFILSLLLARKGAFTGILTGFATLEVNYLMEPIIIFALVAGLGSVFRAYLGYLKVKDSVKFDWSMLLISFVPAVSAALGCTIFMDLIPSVANMVLVFFGAAGVNSLQDKFGLQKKSGK